MLQLFCAFIIFIAQSNYRVLCGKKLKKDFGKAKAWKATKQKKMVWSMSLVTGTFLIAS
jgi:hypothetical protein